jgi:tetratricopeptide (TPR) repeat protein
MDWRRIWRFGRRSTAVVDDAQPDDASTGDGEGTGPASATEAELPTPPEARTPPIRTPAIGAFRFEAADAETSREPATEPEAEPEPPGAVGLSPERARVGRGLGAQRADHVFGRPVAVPSIRETGLLYRLAAEASRDDPEQAARFYDAWLELSPSDPTGLYGRGRVLLELGLVEDALGDFEGAHSLDPGHAEAARAVGWVRASLGRFDAALEAYRAAAALRPDDPELLGEMAQLQRHTGDAEAAAETLARIETLRAG